MPGESQNHMRQEEVERYSAGLASENESASWEEHLLVCDSCRQAVSDQDYRVAMRSAARELRRSDGEKAPGRLRWAAVRIPAAACLVVMAVLAALLLSRWTGTQAPFAVTLSTVRGPAMEAHAPARTPLNVTPDVTGLPPHPSYKLQVVDAVGRRVWSGKVAADGRAALPGLASGVYFARVYSPEGRLLREYGLVIDK